MTTCRSVATKMLGELKPSACSTAKSCLLPSTITDITCSTHTGSMTSRQIATNTCSTRRCGSIPPSMA